MKLGKDMHKMSEDFIGLKAQVMLCSGIPYCITSPFTQQGEVPFLFFHLEMKSRSPEGEGEVVISEIAERRRSR